MTDRDALPIPDYDHLPTGSLASRVRQLDESGVEQLLVFETQHGDREPVKTVLRQRLEELHAGAKPSGGTPSDAAPETGPGPRGGSKVEPSTQGPAVNPPSQGVPTNPSQPRG